MGSMAEFQTNFMAKVLKINVQGRGAQKLMDSMESMDSWAHAPMGPMGPMEPMGPIYYKID